MTYPIWIGLWVEYVEELNLCLRAPSVLPVFQDIPSRWISVPRGFRDAKVAAGSCWTGEETGRWWEVLQNDRPKQVVVPTPSAELQLGGVFCVKHLKSPVRFWMFVSRSFKRLRILEKYCRLPRIIANFPNTIRCWIPIQNGLEHFLKRVNHDKTQKHEDTELKP